MAEGVFPSYIPSYVIFIIMGLVVGVLLLAPIVRERRAEKHRKEALLGKEKQEMIEMIDEVLEEERRR